MGFFALKKLYEVEITEKCTVKAINSLLKLLGAAFLTGGTVVLSPASSNISVGTKGWVVNQLGGKYFAPQNKSALQKAIGDETSNILIPYKNIRGHYEILS